MSAEERPTAALAALAAKLGIAVAKFVAFLVTRSSSLLAESLHSIADTTNETLLLLGRRRADHAATRQHPFGFALTDEMIGTIAGHVALMTGNLPHEVLGGVNVVVHPTTMVLSGPRPGPSPFTVTDEPQRVLGHTGASGPVFLAWDVVRRTRNA